MSYKALYRTYRPQKFSDVVGQEVIVTSLKNSLIHNRISHAYLFCGPRGTGKTTIARIFAKVLNCNHLENKEPCLKCVNCLEIKDGTSPDVIELDAASNNGVDEIREIKDKVKFLPAGSKHKIYIIDEVHMLSNSAFNALLKTLEEPPAHAVFILATTEPHKVIPTIISRCQRFDFKSLQESELTRSLIDVCKKENISYDEEALKEISKASDGGFRDALSFLDQAIALTDDKINLEIASKVTGLVTKDDLLSIANCIENKQIKETLEKVYKLLESGKEITKIITSLISFYKDILIYKVLSGSNDEYLKFASSMSEVKLYFNIDTLSNCLSKLRYGFTLDIYFEVALIKMINVTNQELEYEARIKALEDKFSNLGNYSQIESNNINEENLKLKEIEHKFNHLVNELTKLDLLRVIERVRVLEQNNIEKSDPNSSIKELTLKIDKIVEDLELLKVIQNTFRNELENTQTGSISEASVIEKIEDIVKRNKGQINFTEIETFIKKQLEQHASGDIEVTQLEGRINELQQRFEESLENKKMNLPQEVEKRIYELEKNASDEFFKELKARLLDFDSSIKLVSKIDNKIKEIESNIKPNEVETKQTSLDDVLSRISKLESSLYNLMSTTYAPTKKERKKVDDKQISIWKDEIVTLDKITPSIEPKVNFMELGVNNQTETKTEPVKVEVVKTEVSKTEKKKPKVEDENLFVRRDDIETKEEFKVLKDDVNNNTVIKEVIKETVPIKEVITKKQKEIIKEPIKEEVNILQPETDKDEYESYSVRVLERIMNDSFSPEFASEKQRLQSVWKHLIQLAPAEKRGVAELLNEGEIKAVGNHEFVLIYKTATICNQVMSRRFKRNSLKLLYDLLNGDYNYFAIPISVWEEKREEYANQYFIGTKHPTLTPITMKELRVNNDVSSEDKMLENVIDIFGESVTIKK